MLKRLAAIDASVIDEVEAYLDKTAPKEWSQNTSRHFIVKNPEDKPTQSHPLFDISEQLAEELHLLHPLVHPLEGHPEAVKRFGANDHTVKIYNLPKAADGKSYREVAESSDAFEVHLDGLAQAASEPEPEEGEARASVAIGWRVSHGPRTRRTCC